MIEDEGPLALSGGVLEFPAEPGHLLVSDAVAAGSCLLPSGRAQGLQVLLCFFIPGTSLGVGIVSQFSPIESNESPALACVGQIAGVHPQGCGDLGLELIIHGEVVVSQDAAVFRFQALIDFHDGGNAGEVAINDVTDSHDEFEILLIESCDTGFQFAEGGTIVPAARRIDISILRITEEAEGEQGAVESSRFGEEFVV